MAVNLFGCAVKVIRTNNGSEFNLKELYSSKGIIHQKTCVESPQQKGIMERKHQHILSIARALMIQSSMPMSYWNESVLTTV